MRYTSRHSAAGLIAVAIAVAGALTPTPLAAQVSEAELPPLIVALTDRSDAVTNAKSVVALSITNRSSVERVFHPQCALDAGLSSCVVCKPEVSLKPGETAIVPVRFVAGPTPGTAAVTLFSRDQLETASARQTVLIKPPPGN